MRRRILIEHMPIIVCREIKRIDELEEAGELRYAHRPQYPRQPLPESNRWLCAPYEHLLKMLMQTARHIHF